MEPWAVPRFGALTVAQSRMLADEAWTTERMLAFVRAVLALATLVVAVKFYYDIQFEYRPMALTLELLLVYSLVISVVTRHKPESIRVAAAVSSVLEVALITALIASTGGEQSPFYLWYVFYVVSVSLRYGLQISIVALAASIVLYTIVTTSTVTLSLAGETFIPAFLGSTGFLFILALLFGHMSEKQKSYRIQLAVVNDLGIALSTLSGSAEIEQQLVEQAVQLLQVQRCWFAAWPKGDISGASHLVGADFKEPGPDLGEWTPEAVVRQGQARMSNEPVKDRSMSAEAAKLLSITSIAAAPLMARDKMVGALYAVNRVGKPFSQADLRLLDLIAGQAAPLLENAWLAERLRDTAAAEERLRIARDLHDNFLQTLAAIKLHLERSSLLVDKNPEKAKDAIARTQEIAAAGLSEVRSYLAELRLAGPDPEQLSAALRRLLDEASANAGFKADLKVDINPAALSQDVCSAGFQIVRELVTNAAKHSNAGSVEVVLQTSESNLTMTVRDDGVGFDVREARHAASGTGGLGLVGVEERATLLGGSFTIQSEPGKGTTASVTLPL